MLAPTGIPNFDEVFGGLPKGGLIVVAGGPGTGKTIFSASYLYYGAEKFGEPGIYISLSETRRQFYENMRTLGFDFKKLEEDGLFKFMEFITLLDAGGEMFARISDAVSGINARRLVIDSLTALTHGLKDPRELRVFLHSFLARTAESENCTTIAIEEIPIGRDSIGYGFEEFVASAVITLEKRLHEGRMLRVLNVIKMRGGRLERQQSLFTLDRGFRVFPYRQVKLSTRPERYKPLPVPSKGFSTGIVYLDDFLGGYPKGSTIFFEINPDIPPIQTIPIFANVLADFLSKKRPAIILPLVGLTNEDFRQVLKIYGFSEEEYRDLIRIFAYEEFAEKCKLPYVLPFEYENVIEKLVIVEKELQERTGQSPVKLISLDHLALNQGMEKALHMINHEINRAKANESLTMIASKKLFPDLVDQVKSLVDLHFKLDQLHGSLILYGIKPPTPILGIEIEQSKGYPAAILTPII